MLAGASEQSFRSSQRKLGPRGQLLKALRVSQRADAVPHLRRTMGATDSRKADPGTVRNLFGTDIERNASHGSDSAENAASEIAQKVVKEKMALLEQGKEAGLTFGKPVTLTRNQVQPGFPPDALIKIFQANAAKLPAYISAPAERGAVSVYKVIQVDAPPAPDPERLKAFNNRVGDQVGHELFNAYLASLKAKADVKINQANLEKK